MKKKVNPAPVAVKKDPIETAVFRYVSNCCKEIAKKTPLLAANKTLSLGLGAKPEAEGTLGSWRCSRCGKPCKVTRYAKEKVAPGEPVVVAQ